MALFWKGCKVDVDALPCLEDASHAEYTNYDIRDGKGKYWGLYRLGNDLVRSAPKTFLSQAALSIAEQEPQCEDWHVNVYLD